MTQNTQELPVGAKCTRCRGRATIRMPQHHAIFCEDCFKHYFRTAVRRAMKHFPLPPETPILVAVSGGKDSLALWQVLHDLGYPAKGLHINLGIEDFSDLSLAAVQAFAHERKLSFAHYSLEEALGHDLYELRKHARRDMCSVCGMLKRQLLNRLTIREGFAYLAVGHNLDDEAGRLLGNLVRHRVQYLGKHHPFLPSTHSGLPARLKPLYRLGATEILRYCQLQGITPVALKCPLSQGATSHFFKEALDLLESKMPSTKRDFLFTYLDRNKPREEPHTFVSCRRCGEPTYADLCSVCNLLEKIQANGKNPG
jgi:tRNA-5-methyluridine54 2-sulfurtransferase